MEEVWNYYRLIRFNIQLEEVELLKMECEKFDVLNITDEPVPLKLNLEVRSSLKNDSFVEVFLRVTIDFDENKPFFVRVVYKGVFSQNGTLNEEDFRSQAEDQAVPLLLPYVREYVSDAISRMGYSPYYLPTMDVLQSLSNNKQNSQNEE
ncbi:protein-export chaperone SecB [Paenibacillus sp. FSL M8-0142]|uniref:protein-export chaperone SecB n=1 Tax=Paenibacillus sp. FSL M8-0142 TaxID=2954525 RepID=UPI00315AF3A8